MEVGLEALEKLAGKYEVKAQLLEGAQTESGEMIGAFNSPVDLDLIKSCREAGLEKVNLIYSKDLLKKLNVIAPTEYRMAYALDRLAIVGRLLRLLQDESKNSGRERAIISSEDVYKDPKKGDYSLLLSFGEKLSGRKWHKLKKLKGKDWRLSYRYNEHGILVLIDLRPRGGDYLQRFFKNSRLISVFKGGKGKKPLRLSPEMAPGGDIHIVDDHRDLLKLYKKHSARLIVVGDALAEDYKRALVKVKEYDRYARFMLAANVDEMEEAEFIKGVALNYHRNPWMRK